MAAEADLEKKLGAWCKDRGLLFMKFTSPAHRGRPDRIVVGPGGKILFLELKAPGQKPTPLQEREIRILRNQGCVADWAEYFIEAQAKVSLYCL